MDLTAPLTSIARASWRLGLEGARLSARNLQWTEREMMRMLRARMDATDPDTRHAEPPRVTRPPEPWSPAQVMDGLLERSLGQSGADGRHALFARLVRDLLPDEARILSALSGGDSVAAIQVEARAIPGAPGRLLVQHASTIGSTAGVSVPDMTSRYIGHLLGLGLVELGPALPEPELQYEIIAASRPVRDALASPGGLAVPPRLVRRSLRLTELGAGLWAACEAAGGTA